METSIFLAKHFGLVYLVVGGSILMNREYYRKFVDDFLSNTGLMFFGGVSNLVVGFLIVYFHNVWVQSWVVLITITGWGAILKGGMILMKPQVFAAHARMWSKRMDLTAIFSLILGAVFAYFGFVA